MGLFSKSKQGDKGEKSKKKRLQDRFMLSALNAKFAGTKCSDMIDFDFTSAFTEQKLKIIGHETNRPVIGRGEFEKLYQHSKRITRSYSKFISGDDSPTDAEVQQMIQDFTTLKTLAEDWLASSEAKWSNKDTGKKDRATQIKEIEVRGMLKGANATIFQLKNRDKLQDAAFGKLIEKLEAARDRAQADNHSQKDVEAYRSLDAEILSKVSGSFRPKKGSSEVALVNGVDGEVAYAFKSVEGESTMMGTPKGFGTSREVMMSALVDKLKTKYGIGVGWPKATMASMGGKPGALIDGVQGIEAGSKQLAKTDVPAEALQKILLANFAGGQFDIKWEDVRFEPNGDALDPVCMDGGAAMPDPVTATTFLFGMSDGDPGAGMLVDDSSQPLPQGKEKMDKALVDKFLAIKTQELRADLEAEARRLEKDHQLNTKTLGLDTGINTSITSIEGIQEILRAKQDITLEDFLKAYHAQVVRKKFVEPNRKAWEAAQLDSYRRLTAKHPGLFRPADQITDIPDVYRNVLHPDLMAKLDELEKLARPGTVVELLTRFEESTPVDTIPAVLIRVQKSLKIIADGLKEYETLRTKYPGLIVERTAFATLEQAYLAVMSKSQARALRELQDMAHEASTAEGTAVTAAAILQRYGFQVPTSDFATKFKQIQDRIEAEKAAKEKKEKEQSREKV